MWRKTTGLLDNEAVLCKERKSLFLKWFYILRFVLKFNIFFSFFILANSMEPNPDLLDSLFQQDASDPAASSPHSSSSSSSSSDYTGVAEMILNAKNNFADKWISEGQGMFFFDSRENKLFLVKNNCYFEYLGEGEFQFLRPVDVQSTEDAMPIPNSCEIDEIKIEKANFCECFVTVFSKEELSIGIDSRRKRLREGDDDEEGNEVVVVDAPAVVVPTSLSSLVDYAEFTHNIVGLRNFLKSWNLLSEDSVVRNLLKQDAERIRFIVRAFAPTKANPKNALLKFISALSQFPQKWRCKSPLFQARKVNISSICPYTVFPAGASILRMGSEYYVIREQGGGEYLYLDGMRVSVEDGPMGPLRSGSVMTLSQVKDCLVPDWMCVVELEFEPVNR